MQRSVYLPLILTCLLVWSNPVWSQGVTQCGTPTGQSPFPLDSYQELPDHALPQPGAWKAIKDLKAAWGSDNCRYAQHEVPQGTTPSLKLQSWRGESVLAQAVVWNGGEEANLTYRVDALKGPQGALEASCLETGFVRYVLTDELNHGGGGCGYRPDHREFDSTLVADVIDPRTKSLPIAPQSVRPIWLTYRIPATAAAGTYKTTLHIYKNGKEAARLPLRIQVLEQTLPKTKDCAFHLDLWQNPFAVARYHQVPLWSEAHMEAMRPLMTRLANMGQKVVTASIMHHPWNGQTEDAFESMVTWTRKVDGTWKFDFDVFDRWVEFMASCGLDGQINCYTMVPWALSFQYYDQASDCIKTIEAQPGTQAYANLWIPMLKAFAYHLREKGWFERTCIAMDERPMDVMQKTISIIKQADSQFKVSLAGNYHQEIEADLYDYCITIAQQFPADVKARRAKEGKFSTLYTCCTESHPNTFTFSDLSEGAWIGLYLAKEKVDGYLRWAYNSWVKEPLLDSRFSAWAAGDTYLIYPGDRPSIRLEKLHQGIQMFEKIRILRKTLPTDKVQQLEEALSKLNLQELPSCNCRLQVENFGLLLNTLK